MERDARIRTAFLDPSFSLLGLGPAWRGASHWRHRVKKGCARVRPSFCHVGAGARYTVVGTFTSMASSQACQSHVIDGRFFFLLFLLCNHVTVGGLRSVDQSHGGASWCFPENVDAPIFPETAGIQVRFGRLPSHFRGPLKLCFEQCCIQHRFIVQFGWDGGRTRA